MAQKEKTLLKEANVKILDASIKKTGMSATGRPGTICDVIIETKSGEQLMTCGNKACVTLVNQTVPAKIFKTESKYGPGFEIVFPELKSNYVAPTPNVDTSSISKKLDEILGILHAHFPTASDMSGDSLDDEELTFTAE